MDEGDSMGRPHAAEKDRSAPKQMGASTGTAHHSKIGTEKSRTGKGVSGTMTGAWISGRRTQAKILARWQQSGGQGERKPIEG